MKALLTFVVVIVLCSPAAAFFPPQPFDVELHFIDLPEDIPGLELRMTVPPAHYLYADELNISVHEGRADLISVLVPAAVVKFDPFTEKDQRVYLENVTFIYALDNYSPSSELLIRLEWLGCDDSVCFPPGQAHFRVLDGEVLRILESERVLGDNGLPADLRILERFIIRATATGYMPEDEFLAFLDSGEGELDDGALAGLLARRGLLVMIIVVLAGGLLLNLTPCVLPMIPVNLAIIGAGSGGGPKARGALLGTMYGVGIALVYGVLGVFAVLTGARFGTLNSTWWFNALIGVLFILLSLAMFNVFVIDFSRFQPQGVGGRAHKGSLLAACGMGGVAALLAGACVAPVLISVLLFAADLYASGQPAGLLLPFLLGVGMALPWPFAGAGMAFLPKPGRWMEYVKYGFGAIILALALYYLNIGHKLFSADSEDSRPVLVAALQRAERENKPVVIDFWAYWCTNCMKMKRTTFQSPAVVQRLEDDFIFVEYQAEDMNDPRNIPILNHFGVIGLPTYVILDPRD